jgi:hypothetical protein
MKHLIITVLLAIGCIDLIAQNAINNMQKYVYYKQRFLNNFIAVGNGMGESPCLGVVFTTTPFLFALYNYVCITKSLVFL